TGVANYYRQMGLDEQRDLPEDEVRSAVNTALSRAERMVSAMMSRGLRVNNRTMRELMERHGAAWGEMDFTLDFLLAKDGRLLFLEGGPAGLTFADPCAFLTAGAEEIALSGVAL